jgi:soluble lytic murein transglycosylase-like protein
MNANCYDAATNINIGAQYLKSLLDTDSNIVLAVGSWNGWYKGMTYADVTSAQDSDCYSQQNLD